MQSYSPLSSEINTQELLQEQFPDERYPYFISPKMLLASTNPFLVMVAEGKNGKFIYDNPSEMTEKYAKRLTAVNIELKRLMRINDELYNKKANDEAYEDEEINQLLKDILGLDNAINFIKHYNQEQIYLLSQTTRIYYQEVWNDLRVLGIHNIPESYYENIFPSGELALREVVSDHININVPNEDPDNPENWKFKIDLKIVSVITQAGFEIIGAGTNSPLIANMLLNKHNPCKQLEMMVHAVSLVEKDAKKALEDCRNEILKLIANQNESESRAIQNQKELLEAKLTPLNLITQKIKAFKLGQIELEELISSVAGLVKMAETIPHSGISSQNSMMFFGGSQLRLNSPFVKWMINISDSLNEIKDVLHTNLKPASKQAILIESTARTQLTETELADVRSFSSATAATENDLQKENDSRIKRSATAPAFK